MENSNSNEWKKLVNARNRFISEMSKNMDLYGINQTIGRLYGTVFFADSPITLDEMSEQLGMSKTSMSTGIRALSEAKMVERVWQKGVRKDLYQTEEDWYKSFSAVFVNRWREGVDSNHSELKNLREVLLDLKETSSDNLLLKEVENDLERLQSAEKYYEWLGEVIMLFESGEIYKIVPKK
ncbi:GbsR/MarR family transcriptional regulator [Bacillus sp. FJAT-45350]|uniref:GbsR/MarR family transcriptional regulator n=1 Tax=Bacillus sp. FJAT-45350 TaxID=2011014 RepID=UPI000BB88F01|nr:GbsR/MarR family transcriptional regulator [Bacillus sp. FJAT-45350]